jgi:hypothetical protein
MLMTHFSKLTVSAICLSLFFASLSAFEAKIKFLSGSASVLESGKGALKASVGMSLSQGQSIKTGNDSLVVLALEGGSLLKLKELTELRMDKISGTEAATNRISSLSLLSGSLFSKVSKLRTEESFQIATPGMVAGVRGTSFFVAYGKKAAADKSEDLWLCVNEGKVEVAASASDKKVLVKPGEGIVVPEGKKLTKPKPYNWTKNLNWNCDPEGGNLKDNTSMDSMYKEPLDLHYD